MASVILYDPECRILWVSMVAPGFSQADFVGKLPWDCVEAHERLRCENIFLRCLATKSNQQYDVDVTRAGRWRTWLYPVHFGQARILGLTQQIPPDVLLLTDRQREVCAAIADCHGSKLAAKKLGVTRSTIDNHRSQIAQRVGIPAAGIEAWCGANRKWFEQGS